MWNHELNFCQEKCHNLHVPDLVFRQEMLGSKSPANTHPAGLGAFPIACDTRSSAPLIQLGHLCVQAESGCCHFTLVPMKGKSIQSFQRIEAKTYFASFQCFSGFAVEWESPVFLSCFLFLLSLSLFFVKTANFCTVNIIWAGTWCARS